MHETAIQVEALRKAYRIGLKEQRHETLAGALTAFVRSPIENYRNVSKLSRFDDLKPQTRSASLAREDVIWALDDVSFKVNHGEVLAIIGQNGAGKSTLLKILSKITDPTSGRATIYGRVGSLLEVGTGFHPDLTGRENVYLNGTILGMRKKEVDRKFDEIVAFSEVDKFIDTPVKRYSTGMRVRLAFGVAACLEPEILIVDEVLAVGDLNFQKKCLGKMGEVAKTGRTVLFVSHNLAAVVQLCHRGIVLKAGKVCFEGSSSQSVDFYVRSNSDDEEGTTRTEGSVRFDDLRVGGSILPVVAPYEALEVAVTLTGSVNDNPLVILVLEDTSGRTIIHERRTVERGFIDGGAECVRIRISIPALFLSSGLYSLYLKAFCTTDGRPVRIVSNRLPIEVRGDSDGLGNAMLAPAVNWYS
jgi:ABC-type polysaccharide/polyol phosphate transport system ATPase subunit